MLVYKIHIINVSTSIESPIVVPELACIKMDLYIKSPNIPSYFQLNIALIHLLLYSGFPNTRFQIKIATFYIETGDSGQYTKAKDRSGAEKTYRNNQNVLESAIGKSLSIVHRPSYVSACYLV